jgi:hypothetical protein
MKLSTIGMQRSKLCFLVLPYDRIFGTTVLGVRNRG